MKPFFFVGNRRSGTSMFTMVLNEHNNIYMSLEADSLWYIHTEGANTIPPDDLVHMSDYVPRRVANADQYLQYDQLIGTPRAKFFQDILHIKEHGVYGRQDPYPEKLDEDILWIGEKKPGVASNPAMRDWMIDNFPDARYLHLVRDPRYVIGSMARLGWANGNIEFLTELWVELEDQAHEFNCLRLKFEEVSKDPFWALANVAEYLDLDPEAHNNNKDQDGRMITKRGTIMSGYTSTTDEWAERVTLTYDLERCMEMYGYG